MKLMIIPRNPIMFTSSLYAHIISVEIVIFLSLIPNIILCYFNILYVKYFQFFLKGDKTFLLAVANTHDVYRLT